MVFKLSFKCLKNEKIIFIHVILKLECLYILVFVYSSSTYYFILYYIRRAIMTKKKRRKVVKQFKKHSIHNFHFKVSNANARRNKSKRPTCTGTPLSSSGLWKETSKSCSSVNSITASVLYCRARASSTSRPNSPPRASQPCARSACSMTFTSV